MKIFRFFARRALAVVTATCFAAIGVTAVTTVTALAAANNYLLSDTDNVGGVLLQGTTTAQITLAASLYSTGTTETDPPTLTDVFPTGVVPTAPGGTTPWNCSGSSGQNVSCVYTGANLSPGASYPTVVVAVQVLASATAGPGTDSATVSSLDETSGAGAADHFTVELLATAPTITTVSAGDSAATVAFTAPGNNGDSAITGYVITPFLGLIDPNRPDVQLHRDDRDRDRAYPHGQLHLRSGSHQWRRHWAGLCGFERRRCQCGTVGGHSLAGKW